MASQQDFIISFFGTDDTIDSEGRTFNDLLRYNNQELEYHHDYIQLLFPLPEVSIHEEDISNTSFSVMAVRDALRPLQPQS